MRETLWRLVISDGVCKLILLGDLYLYCSRSSWFLYQAVTEDTNFKAMIIVLVRFLENYLQSGSHFECFVRSNDFLLNHIGQRIQNRRLDEQGYDQHDYSSGYVHATGQQESEVVMTPYHCWWMRRSPISENTLPKLKASKNIRRKTFGFACGLGVLRHIKRRGQSSNSIRNRSYGI